MTPKEFYTTVVKMRTAQKMYFKSRNEHYLKESMKLEQMIDEEINRVNELTNQKLFK